jgi:Predicted phosphosugar isomerases
MLKFDENAILNSVNGALALRPQVEKIVDKICADGFENLFFVGIGGTYASCMQTVTYMSSNSSLNVYVENAAELLTSGNRKFGPSR